ncbi:hypothetical protein [Mesorhizobium sp. CA4]|nr:hypothetical protein [Mesorhizobium sp. CA4]
MLRGKGEVTVSADKYGTASFPLKGSGCDRQGAGRMRKGSGGEA